MAETKIEWTDHSINPIRARNRKTGAVGHYCEMVSAGCAHCYASNLQKRFNMPKFPGHVRTMGRPTGDVAINVNEDIEIFFDESKLQEVLRRKKPTKYFWCDMTDLFGHWVPDAWIDKCFAVMALTPQHTHQVLTKRAERMREYMRWDGHSDEHARRGENCPCRQCGIVRAMAEIVQAHGVDEWTAHVGAAGYVATNWPLPNVWLGCSVENQEQADKRIPWLLQTPAAVRFLSLEPLLGPVTIRCANSESDRLGLPFRPLKHDIHWIICGGESGPKARPCNVEWIRSIVAQCKAADVACFVKQLGGNVVDPNTTSADTFPDRLCWPNAMKLDGHRVFLRDKKGGDPSEWPDDLRVREFPKAVTA